MYKVERIAKNYGELQVFQGLSLEFPEGKITAILGPSGCGKTTILKIMAGLIEADRGAVISTAEVGFLFQEPRLLPWLTIYGNLALVLKDKLPSSKVAPHINHYLQAVGLEEYRDFYPRQLSGGMKQRAAMARAFSYPSELLLMDEPFKSLDLKIRHQLVSDFLKLWRQKPKTVVVVTHDVKEAVWLGDRIAILSEKPARVVKNFQNGIPANLRLTSAESLGFEEEITKVVLSSTSVPD